MANYQTLKAAINAVIKANGNKEITGTVLNETLLAIVNSLGVGYQFVGVATPSTNPGTPDQKVFYIASQAGTYTNFNGAVVSDGIAIFEWNGTWTTEMLDLSMAGQVQSDWTETDTTKKSYIKHKPNIPPSANVDPEPTNGSPNAVASGGVYNALKAITDFLNNGYYFVGIAGTSTVPDTVTQYGIFYIASDGGTYTNFLNGDDEPLTLYQGLNILYKDIEDDGWNYFEVFKFSDFVDTTQQQSLSSQQKAQARTNIAAVSYDQQSLSADQQVQAQNNMVGKAYAPAQFSGLGKKVLAKNIEKVSNVDHNYMTQAFFKNGDDFITNTVFVIQYDYELKENVEIGAGCILDFDGGSISGAYTITGNDTQIKAPFVKIFGTDITLAGTWNTEGHIRWFGADPAKADNAVYIQKALDSFLVVKIDAFYYKTSPLIMTKAHSLIGDSVRIEGTWIGFLLDENETGLTFQPTGGGGTQFKYIKGITFMDYNAPGTSPYYQTGTIGVDNTSARLDVEYCTFRNFDTGIKGGKNTWNNKFINCRYEKMNIAIDGITSNYVIIDKCEVRNINTFLTLDGQDYPQDRPLAVNTAGIVVVSNSIFENTGNYLFIARKQEYTTLIFENNYVEIYSGDVFHGNFKHIRDINNFYYFGGTVKQLAYLWKPISIVAEGNKIYLNQSGNSFNRIYTCHPEYAESGDNDMLNTISSIANRIVRENHTGAIIDFELGATVNQYTIMIGFSYGSNGEMNPISYFTSFKEKGTTAQRPTYNQYVKGKQYFDTDINKPLWWNGSQWIDGAGNVIS